MIPQRLPEVFYFADFSGISDKCLFSMFMAAWDQYTSSFTCEMVLFCSMAKQSMSHRYCCPVMDFASFSLQATAGARRQNAYNTEANRLLRTRVPSCGRFPPAEEEDAVRFCQVQAKRTVDHGRQAVNPFPKIRITCTDIDPFKSRGIIQYDGSLQSPWQTGPWGCPGGCSGTCRLLIQVSAE